MSRSGRDKGDKSRDEIIAGEYVLGVLDDAARRDVEIRINKDPEFSALVERWTTNLSDFNDEYEEAAAPLHVLSETEHRLFPARRIDDHARPYWSPWNSLAFWRGLAAVLLLGVLTLAGINNGLFNGPNLTGNRLVADLSAADATLDLFVSFDQATGVLNFTPTAASPPEQNSLELWLINGSEAPMSLGIIDRGVEDEIIIQPSLRRQFAEGSVLAISVEPFGGSPTGSPTGPIVASGMARNF